MPEIQGKLLFQDDFESVNDNWFAEMEIPESSYLLNQSGYLELIAKRGATVWFKNKLSGNYIISYDVCVIDSGGITDRVSDLNLFWNATNPDGKFFNLDGKFPSYDLLHLYYAGIGGNENTTTRFRKYSGVLGDKAVIKEYTDSAHLIKGNIWYAIKLIYKDGRSRLYVNDNLYFDYADSAPYDSGFFGFRTTRSHMRFDHFKVYAIEK
jgi:rhamnogalacturonan endolyase